MAGSVLAGVSARAGPPPEAVAESPPARAPVATAGPGTGDVSARSRVVEARSEYVLSAQVIHPRLLADMLRLALLRLTDASTPGDAWRRILRPDDVIGVKFSCSGADQIGTTPALAEAIVRSLTEAGFSPERIVLLEEGEATRLSVRTAAPERRYTQRRWDFGCGSDAFIGFVEQVTALINVPFLKTHFTATMSGALKNLSHGLIRHPARFHTNGCDPAIGRIVASEPIRSRLRLNVVNALRVVYHRGPEAREENTAAQGALLAAFDPVAADAIGYELLNQLRATRNLPPVLPLPRLPQQIVTAGRLGLGRNDHEQIEWCRIDV